MQQLSKVQICQTEQKIKESNMTVEKPRLIKQNRYLDFGFGFYTTTNRDQAVNFAQKVTERRKTGKATLNIYSVDENVAFEECSLLRFDNPDEIWLDFVAENRQGTYQEKQYDLIYGAVANDDVYRTITLYMTGVLDKEQTLMALKIRKLFNTMGDNCIMRDVDDYISSITGNRKKDI